jgi:Phosphotransferase enzyme family
MSRAAPDTQETARIRSALGDGFVSARRINRGYANNRRWVVTLAGGRRAFVKHPDDPRTATWLRREFEVYQHVCGDFHPDVLGWFDDGELPALVLDDLSGCVWPPPWTAARIESLFETLARIAGQEPPPHTPAVGAAIIMPETGWAFVAQDPVPLLSLGLCTRGWLDGALPTLIGAADPRLLDGTALLHTDVRSDNLCFRAGATLLVDWNHTSVGNAEIDVAFLLPSLHLEGGPAPQKVAPHVTPGMAAHVAGYFAGRAGLPAPPTAPLVRHIQRRQLEVALPWAAALLDLPPPDGAAVS